MIEGKTKSGFKFHVDERILDDWRLVEAIKRSESDDASEVIRGMTDLVDLVVGDQGDALKKHIADKNEGYIPKGVILTTITEIINESKELKNSQSSEG